MKKSVILGKALLGAAIFTFSVGATSCKNESKQDDPKEVAEDQNEVTFDENNDREDDSQYLVEAAETDLKEIELGNLAQNKSTNADVKAFAKMMVDQHTKALNDLKATAEKKNISIPTTLTEKGQDKFKDLNDKSGHDFDKKFAEMMVDGHEKAIDKMEKASEKANDEEIRMWATNMIPTLQHHLEEAKKLKDKVDAMKR